MIPFHSLLPELAQREVRCVHLCPTADLASEPALPADEYIRDGGDEGRPAGVTRQAEVLGLEMEDTVAHYDTLDGRTLVEPSNEVIISAHSFVWAAASEPPPIHAGPGPMKLKMTPLVVIPLPFR